jgi:CRP-like cAMP-binding protein
MQKPFDSSESSLLAFANPVYLPLQGSPAEQAQDLLIRKGALLQPQLTRLEAKGITRYMHLEHFRPGNHISFDAQDETKGRLMLIIAGEANIRMRAPDASVNDSDYSPLGQVKAKWFNVTEGATLGLMHAFSGLASRFMAQAVTELFVASLPRQSFQRMKQDEPILALRFLEITTLELALVALDHEKTMVALTSVARSMQDFIGEETPQTQPASLLELSRA